MCLCDTVLYTGRLPLFVYGVLQYSNIRQQNCCAAVCMIGIKNQPSTHFAAHHGAWARLGAFHLVHPVHPKRAPTVGTRHQRRILPLHRCCCGSAATSAELALCLAPRERFQDEKAQPPSWGDGTESSRGIGTGGGVGTAQHCCCCVLS